jgi:hypothetical protein
MPIWVKYAGDIFFLVIFLVILFFFKPDPADAFSETDDESEQPNPLERMLVSEDNHGSEEKIKKPENE